MISWLERIEAACLYAKRDPRQEALGHSGGKALDSILSIPSSQPWKILKETLMRDYSEFKSPAHSCMYLENMTQGEDESLRLYVYRYTRAHRMVTERKEHRHRGGGGDYEEDGRGEEEGDRRGRDRIQSRRR